MIGVTEGWMEVESRVTRARVATSRGSRLIDFAKGDPALRPWKRATIYLYILYLFERRSLPSVSISLFFASLSFLFVFLLLSSSA